MTSNPDLDSMLLAMVGAHSLPTASTGLDLRPQRNLMSDDDDMDNDDPWGHNLMGNSRDQEYLQSLPELEREAILADRAEQRQKFQERRALRQKLREQHETQYSSSRSTETDKKKKMQALKDKHGARRGGTRYDSSDSEYEPEAAISMGNSLSVNGPLPSLQANIAQHVVLPMGPSAITYDALKSIQITRDQIEKFCYAEFFEELVVGIQIPGYAFVRLRIGDQKGQPLYRLAQVIDVVNYKRPYKIQRTKTKKAFKMKHGLAERVFLADIFSNQPFTEHEFQRWRITCEKESVALPTPSDIERKSRDISNAELHSFSEQEMAEILRKKKQENGGITRNFAVEKAELIKKRQVAQSRNDTDRVVDLDLQLDALEQSILERKSRLTPVSASKRSNLSPPSLSGSHDSFSSVVKRKRSLDYSTSFSMQKMNPIPVVPILNLPSFDLRTSAPNEEDDEMISVTDIFANGPKIDLDLDI